MPAVKDVSVFAISRVGVAVVWIYHGLVPKLLFCDPTELELVALGPVIHSAVTTTRIAGVVELLLGVSVLLFWRSPWPMRASLLLFVLLMVGGVALKPGLATQAFNPVSLTIAAAALCLINLRCNDGVSS